MTSHLSTAEQCKGHSTVQKQQEDLKKSAPGREKIYGKSMENLWKKVLEDWTTDWTTKNMGKSMENLWELCDWWYLNWRYLNGFHEVPVGTGAKSGLGHRALGWTNSLSTCSGQTRRVTWRFKPQDLMLEWLFSIMWVKQCHKPTPQITINFTNRLYQPFPHGWFYYVLLFYAQ